MNHRYTTTVTLLTHAFPLDIEVGSSGQLLLAKDRFRDLPELARRLTLGDQAPAFYRALDLYLDLLKYAVPLWQHGLSVPEVFAEVAVASPVQLLKTTAQPTGDEWVDTIHRTFGHHGPHWYHVAHVVGQIMQGLSKPETDWTQIVYLLQAGGPFFAPIIIRLLPEVTDPGLRSRLLNALLFFPTEHVQDITRATLPKLPYSNSVGTLSLVSTLRQFDFPESRHFREGFITYAVKEAPEELPVTGITAGEPRVVAAAWRQLGSQEYTNQAAIRYLLAQPDTNIEKLVAACRQCRDWQELLGRFQRDFRAAGYTGAEVPSLDQYVRDNLERYKWPTGERHHNRIDPEIRHALFQQSLQAGTLDLLHERLADKDAFRRDCAAMHLAAYCQLPRIYTRKTEAGQLESYFGEPPAQRAPLAAETVARLLSLTVDDHRVTAYHFAARAISQLAIDPVHGAGITDYLLERARENAQGTDLVFCTYLLLPTYHLQPAKEKIRALLPEAIAELTGRPRAAFGRLLVQLFDPSLTHAFLQKIAPSQAHETYAMFEELAQAVNLLEDRTKEVPLAVFHPAFKQVGADAGA